KSERVRPFPLVGPDDTYDVKKYLEMLVKATEEILIHLGYNAKRLKEMVDPNFLPLFRQQQVRERRVRKMKHN
ncbi:MAG: hypothetical protein ACXWMH_05195, partial [Syntrophales bacterium]